MVCATGSFAALAPTIDRAMLPALPPRASRERATWGELLASARAHAGEAQVIVLASPADPRERVAEAILRHGPGRFSRLYLDPRDARVLGRGRWWNAQRIARDLHRSLFLGENAGIFLVGALALPLLASTLSGLLVARWTRRSLRIARGRIARDGHRAVGLVLAPFALLVALTGAWYWLELGLGWAGVSATAPLPRVEAVSAAEMRDLDALVALGRRAYPDLVIESIALPTARRPVLSLLGRDGSFLSRDQASQVFLDPRSREVLAVWRPDAMGPAERWAHAADPLHFGDLGGTPTRLAWSAMGLGLAVVAAAGPWIRRRRRR